MRKKLESRKQSAPTDFIQSVGALLKDVTELGYVPILVGGMALVTLGSTRVTKDFDFLIEEEARKKKKLMDVFYKHGLELVSKLDKFGNVLRTVDNPNVAFLKLDMDTPKSAYFYNHARGLRVDLLFDFPIPAKDVYKRSHQKKIQSHVFRIADKQDLLTMKEIAIQDRRLSSDLQDLEFLQEL